MSAARKRPTALDRARAQIVELEEQLARAERYVDDGMAERRRLEDRCGWLFGEAQALGAEVVRLRLSAGYMSPERYAQDTPNANPQTSLMLTRPIDDDRLRGGAWGREPVDGEPRRREAVR